MSLINQALKLEQQRRQTTHVPQAPMIGHMARRGQRSNLSMMLLGITGMGLLLAVSVTAILYFGNGYLEQKESSLASSQSSAEAPSPTSTTKATPQTGEAEPAKAAPLENLLGTLSQEQLSTVQQMLQQQARQEQQAALKPQTPQQTEPPSTQSVEETPIAKITQIQDIVDAYSVQGIRKAGQDTRVFLNGKIRRIGEVVDLEHDLRLIGFTDNDLVFRTPDGRTYKKPL